jgi:hypothetical protein
MKNILASLTIALTTLTLTGCVTSQPVTGSAHEAAPAPTPAPPPSRAEPPSRKFTSAKFIGSSECANGGFFDPRKGGECWQCPSGTKRTVFPVTANNACQRQGGTTHRAVESRKRATGALKTKCGKGYFLHRLAGWCFRCPAGYKRTVSGINTTKACSSGIPAKSYPATKQKAFGCTSPAFQDPRNGGECWRCPTAWKRSIFRIGACLSS